jgi:hypothetical protein
VGNKPVNAVKGKQGFQKTGRTPQSSPSAVDDIATMLAGQVDAEGPSSPKSVDVLHDLYAAKASVRTDGDFLAPSESVPIDFGAKEDGISTELFVASESVQSSFGISAPGERQALLAASTKAVGVHRDTRILPPDEAAAEVSLAMNLQEGSPSQEAFLDRVRKGEVSLTVSEVAVLHNIREEIRASRALEESTAVPFDEDGVWSPPYANRHCTLCGKFVGKLGSHAGHCSPMAELHTRYSSDAQSRKGTIAFLGDDGVAHETKLRMAALAKRHADLPIEKLQDAFLASSYWAKSHYDSPDLWICRAIVGKYLKKPMFGETRLTLPRELREAYLSATHREPRPAIVAQLIDPPFTPGELEHLIDTDESSWAEHTKELLTSPRARDDVLRILENSPSRAGTRLATNGHIPVENIRNMAQSGDAAVRMQATNARNLPADEALRLATDPDPDIRRNMLRKIEAFPEMLDVFVNDPDEEIAVEALAWFPGQRQAAVAISKVTSRKRLQAIHDRLPEMWIPAGIISDSQPNDPHPRVQAVNSIQGWIRERLATAS